MALVDGIEGFYIIEVWNGVSGGRESKLGHF